MNEIDIAEEKKGFLSNETILTHRHVNPQPRKGGLRTMPFIIINESFEKVASYGLMPNMIFYLMYDYGMSTANASIILLLWSALSNVMAIFGAFLSDSYLGRFKVIALGSFSSLLGMILLWLTTVIPWMKPSPCGLLDNGCNSTTAAQLAVLFSSFGLISIGAGCVRPCSMAFGADQLDNKEKPGGARVLQSYFQWYYASIGLSTILALTVIVYLQENAGWKVGFGVPVILMASSVLMFLVGSSLYVKMGAGTSFLTGFAQVFAAAFKNRDLCFPTDGDSSEWYYRRHGSKYFTPTNKLRCLNKACIIRDPARDLNPDGSASNPWSLCDVEQVESLKSVIRALPMWSANIMMMVSLSQSSFATLQAKTMNRHITQNFQIPAGSFNVVMIVTITIWVAFYDRVMVPLLLRYTGRPLGTKTRMGIGLVLSCMGMALSAIIEGVRRRTAIEEGLEDQPNVATDMSAMWLVPQYVLLGLAEAFNAVGQVEFYYSQFPRSLSSFAMALFTLGMAFSSLVGTLLVDVVNSVTSKGGKESWLSNNINKGHIDYYYWLITVLCSINFVYFLVCCWVYGPPEDERTRASNEVEEEFEHRNLPSA
ncbi:protein NRT1/ PTR FAMILY 1.2-like [Malania oleifera]|uniref:protein NRT1/ PTR FAMILY 1.2-like n=1 Tax=Malania oleifera TaxID=397392 RepID=UPI0025AE8C35|nr:protein NRT1/ PTR FAMILY 1.2-like [Malania oleifera]